MSIILVILLSALAGLLNGSFATPMKYMRQWHEENIWLPFSILAFLILPYIVLICFPDSLHTFLHQMPLKIMLTLLAAGFIFGCGMILFSTALRFVGIGMSFLLNISMNTLIGALGPLLVHHSHVFLTRFGLLQILAMGVFIIAIVLACRATLKREPHDMSHHSQHSVNLGLSLAILSGLCTSAQGFAYNITAPAIQALAIQTSSSAFFGANVPWLPIFGAALIPYASYFAILNYKKHLYVNYFKKSTRIYWLILLGMASFYFVSVFLFGKASTLLGQYGALLAWPLLMIFIILTSNFWGWQQGEWRHAPRAAIISQWASISLMVIAIIILSLNGYLYSPF